MRWPPPSDWPNATLSQQVMCRPHRWHVQEAGTGPTVLMLHGAGGSTHSFRHMIPDLGQDHHMVALDLPGQGFTQLGARHRSGMNETADDILRLCTQEAWAPTAIVGHSAGAALALRLSQRMLSPRGQPPKVIGINAALDQFPGLAGVLFPALAKMLAAVPFTAQIFSATARDPRRIQALIGSTGSEIDASGLKQYGQLFADRDHADATLMMMAQWELDDLIRDLHTIEAETLFLAAENDRTVPPSVSEKSARRMRNAKVVHLPECGHLAHEEAPHIVANLIREFVNG